MDMNAEDWLNFASVYRAGADRARGWSLNNDRQQDAAVLDAMADRCEYLAGERPFFLARPGQRPYSYHRTRQEAERQLTHMAEGFDIYEASEADDEQHR
jgi:hypothetical protein